MARGGQAKNYLYYGDNLDVLRQYIEDESVDLIYLDPPFNSDRDYNVPHEAPAQIQEFEDTWEWDERAAADYEEVRKTKLPVSGLLESFKEFLSNGSDARGMIAYLSRMTIRLIEMHRVLKRTGSLYLHCDSTASHYLKLLLDALFGKEFFMNEIVWKRTTAHNDPQRYGRIQDRILYYSKSEVKTFNHIGGEFSEAQLKRYKFKDQKGYFKAENLTAPHFSPTRTVEWRGTHPGRNRQWRFSTEELESLYDRGLILLKRNGTPRKDGLKEYLSDQDNPALQDIWTDIVFGPTSGERLGYNTQKPVELLERNRPGLDVLTGYELSVHRCGGLHLCGSSSSMREAG